MRVIAGKAKGKKLLAVPGTTTRPILDRVRTALFDCLRGQIENIRMLDLFAGTGSVGIEALSQGAEHCVFTDLSSEAVDTIKKNLENTQLANQAEVRNTDAFSYLKNTSKCFDIIYVAPPQYLGLWERALMMIAERPELVTQNGKVIVQIDPSEYAQIYCANFTEIAQKTYGKTMLIFFERNL